MWLIQNLNFTCKKKSKLRKDWYASHIHFIVLLFHALSGRIGTAAICHAKESFLISTHYSTISGLACLIPPPPPSFNFLVFLSGFPFLYFVSSLEVHYRLGQVRWVQFTQCFLALLTQIKTKSHRLMIKNQHHHSDSVYELDPSVRLTHTASTTNLCMF